MPAPVQTQHLACVFWLLSWLFFRVHFPGGGLHAAGGFCVLSSFACCSDIPC